jgi:hypothetical protein
MGTAKPLSTIMEDIGHWFKHKKHGLYLKHIQAEHQFVVGWALYSVNTMDATKLQQELEQLMGFPVQARWQIINTGNNKDLKDSEKHRALHFRVDQSLQEQALDILEEIYSSRAKTFPLGYKMRLIPQKERMLNPRNAEAFEELRQRQGNLFGQYEDNSIMGNYSVVHAIAASARFVT